MEDVVSNGGDLPTIDVSNILGRTFITTPNHEGEQVPAQIESAEFLQRRTADEMEPLLKFKCRVGDERFEQVMTYNRVLQWCDHDKDKGEFFRLVSIVGHCKRNNAKGGHQVRVNWASGLTNWQDLNDIFRDDPVAWLYTRKRTTCSKCLDGNAVSDAPNGRKLLDE